MAVPRQVLHFICHPESALSFQRKHRCILNSLSPVLQITIWKEENYSPSLDVISVLRKNPKYQRHENQPKNPKKHFQDTAMANYTLWVSVTLVVTPAIQENPFSMAY